MRFCEDCYRALRAALESLPRAYNGLVSAMAPSPRGPFQVVKGVRGGSGIRINEDASAGRSEILGFLRSWTALVADECALRRPAGHDCNAMTAFLVRNLCWLLSHPAAGDFEEEITALTARLRELDDSSPAHFDIGACVRPGCGSALFVAVSADGRREVHCRGGHVWQADQWLQLYRQLQGT